VRAYRQSSFKISSVQPLSIERRARPRAITSQAVNIAMSIVARKNGDVKVPISIDEVLEKTNEYINSFGKQLISESGWSKYDAGLAVIASIVGVIANASCVTGATDDKEVLLEAGGLITKAFPKFKLKVRNSL